MALIEFLKQQFQQEQLPLIGSTVVLALVIIGTLLAAITLQLSLRVWGIRDCSMLRCFFASLTVIVLLGVLGTGVLVITDISGYNGTRYHWARYPIKLCALLVFVAIGFLFSVMTRCTLDQIRVVIPTFSVSFGVLLLLAMIPLNLLGESLSTKYGDSDALTAGTIDPGMPAHAQQVNFSSPPDSRGGSSGVTTNPFAH